MRGEGRDEIMEDMGRDRAGLRRLGIAKPVGPATVCQAPGMHAED